MNLPILLCNLAKVKYYLKYVIRNRMPQNAKYKISEEYWNERAESYARQYGTELLLCNVESIIREEMNLYERVMEMGCGIGSNLKVLAKTFPQITFTGLDHSELMLSNARKNLKSYDNVRLINADLETINRCSMELQDLVFSRAVLQHLSPSSVRNVVGYLFEGVTERLYMEELSIRGYPDGKTIKWPGFPEDLYFSHDYLNIVREFADIRYYRYRRGIILQLFCVKKRK